MSESEVDGLRRDIRDLAQQQGKQHEENKKERDADRLAFQVAIADTQKSFSKAMDAQRDQFQISINQTFAQYQSVKASSDRNGLLLEIAIGDGHSGSGRLGAIETTVEKLKQFRWQALTLGAVALWLSDKILSLKH